MIGIVAPSAPPGPLKTSQRIKAMLTRMGARWAALSDELAYLDSGLPIPRRAPASAWRAPSTRRLGLFMPRLELSPGESVFVLLLVKHGFVMERVASEADEDQELLQLLRDRPAVSQALENWWDVKRLPLCP